MPRRNGLPHGPSDRGPSRHGRLVDNVVHLTRVRVARVSWSRHGTSGSRPRRPGSLVECGPKDPGPSPPGPRYSPGSLAPSTRHPGLLVDPAVPRTRPRVPRDSWTSPHALGPGHESPRTAGKPRGSSDTGPSHAGQLVDTTGHQTRARFAQEIWSKPRALGTGRESPGAPWSIPQAIGLWPVSPRTMGQPLGP